VAADPTSPGADEVDCSRRQVFDIPPIKVHVTEHQIISRRCRCGKTTTGRAPAQAGAPVQYGPVMCAVIIYLFMGQFLSKKAHRPSDQRIVRDPGQRRHRRGRHQ
jgi:transposase